MAASHQNFLVLHPGTRKESKVELLTLKKADITIRALNHKLRLQIIRLLQDKGEMTVTEIYSKLKLEQSVASQHLAILRRAGIVNTRRDGKFIFYTLNTGRIEEIYNISKTLVP
jgi:ArsR family transcriptional regulator, virulence genes transcriptional regulator